MSSIDLNDVIVILAIFGTFATVYFVLKHLQNKQAMSARLKDVLDSKRSQHINQGTEVAKSKETAMTGQSSKFPFSLLETYINKTTKGKAAEYKLLFDKAGWDHRGAAFLYPLLKLGSVAFFYILALMMTIFAPIHHSQESLIRLAILGAGIYLGFRFVDLVLDIVIKTRYARIKKGLSGALDLMVVCTKAGLGIDRGFEQVAQETGLSNPDLCKELTLTAIELSILPDRRAAYENLALRVDIPLVRAMTTTLIQSEEQGTSVSHTLKILSDEFRQQKIFEAEGKAARLPTLLTLPIILLIFPILLIIILGPSIIAITRTLETS